MAGSFSSFFYCSARGNVANEDFAYATSTYGVLVDGATVLMGKPLFCDRNLTNAQWLSHTAGSQICRLLDAGTPAEEAIERATAAAGEELAAALGCPLTEADPDLIPSATLCVAVLEEGCVKTFGLGDSPMVVRLRDGSMRSFTDETLEALDDHTLSCMVERVAGRKMPGPDKRKLVADVNLAVRRKRNVEDGYWCYDPTGAGLAHMRRATYDMAEVDYVAGMSDGFYHAFSLYGLADEGETLADLTYFGALELIDRMRAVEAGDPDYDRYPRMKLGDDASVFMLRA